MDKKKISLTGASEAFKKFVNSKLTQVDWGVIVELSRKKSVNPVVLVRKDDGELVRFSAIHDVPAQFKVGDRIKYFINPRRRDQGLPSGSVHPHDD